MTRGSKIILSLKPEMKEYLEEKKLKELVNRYSEFINFPIFLYTKKEVSKEVELEEDEVPEEPVEELNEDEPIKIENNDEDDNDEPALDEKSKKKTKTVKETVFDWDQVNENKAIWLKPIEEVEDAEYKSFYKALTKDY